MSAQMPTLPPRPARSQERSSEPLQDAPQIPPRPARVPERSESPHRAEYTRSPLNEPPTSMHNGGKMYSQKNLSAQDLPRRPPSVSLPLIGQEGNEYASFDGPQEAPQAAREQTRNVSPDLPMHAPKASVPQSTAKSRISTVTRTDSSQAAAAGIGKADSETPSLKTKSSFSSSHPLKTLSSFNRSNISVNSQERPGSAGGHDDEEHGIPSFGMQVPMLKYAGDVQAPSPAPFTQTQSTGIGFFNEGQAPRNHHRKRSSRQEFGPPGSYGMHGHGLEPKDQFEKAWYQKHPEEYSKEAKKQYDPGHPSHEWALSSDDLNKLVHQTRDQGMGTTPGMIGTPTEQIGYLASEEYASRMTSPKPRPASLSGLNKRPSNGSQTRIESPLRKTSFHHNESGHLKTPASQDNAIESDVEDDDIIHVDAPDRRTSKYEGGGYDPPTEDFGPRGGNTEEEGGWVVENGYGVPILASDEVAKNLNPDAVYMQPAVSPEQERRGNDYYAGYDSDHPPSYQTGRRSNSRPGSAHGEPLSRFISREAAQGSGMGTPLEEIEEYEPLFPEDDDKQPSKPLNAADKLKKRPDLARHHFPSQDIWEDTPESLQYQTTVEHPQEPEDLTASASFERPEQEQARKEPIPSDRADFLTEATRKMAQPHFKPGVSDDMVRPDMARRFPSRDVWEDSPDSLHLETTVSGPQMDEQNDLTSPPDAQPHQGTFAKPSVPARPARSGLSQQIQPDLPAQPAEKRQAPAADSEAPQIPARPKPQVPARPARAVDGQEGASLAKTVSGESGSSGSTVTSPPAVKAKPAVPSRPVGSKFAALKAGFMNDLNSRLQLGPQAPKAAEPATEEPATEEKAPLADARKGRARGPARRKPAAEAATASESSSSAATLSIASPFTLFQINDHGEVSVPTSGLGPEAAESAKEIEKIASANVDGAGPSERATAAPVEEKTELSGMTEQAIGHAGDTPEPRITSASLDRQKAIEPSLEAALADSRKDIETAPASTSTDIASQVPAFSSEVPIESSSSSKTADTTDRAAQTGEQKIDITSPKGEKEKMTVTLGGNAPDEADVVQKESGEEIVG
ncbi:hypothetical protein MBLNU459_g1110t2 [Dothideomycetes sp. NU459]